MRTGFLLLKKRLQVSRIKNTLRNLDISQLVSGRVYYT